MGRLNLSKKSIVRVIAGTLAILAVPLIAMQFSSDVKWELGDFIIIGTLLLITGLSLEFVASKNMEKNKKILATAGVLLVAFYIYAELAVGVFTNIGS